MLLGFDAHGQRFVAKNSPPVENEVAFRPFSYKRTLQVCSSENHGHQTLETTSRNL